MKRITRFQMLKIRLRWKIIEACGGQRRAEYCYLCRQGDKSFGRR